MDTEDEPIGPPVSVAEAVGRLDINMVGDWMGWVGLGRGGRVGFLGS